MYAVFRNETKIGEVNDRDFWVAKIKHPNCDGQKVVVELKILLNYAMKSRKREKNQ